MNRASVLILATNYDIGSFYTSSWARGLHEDLAKKGHICVMLETSDLCRSGSALTDAVNCVDYVVFYGHGLKDEWTALPALPPSVTTTPLLDAASVQVLGGRKIYAGCCDSLAGMGPAYNKQFQGLNDRAYIGYTKQFGFEEANNQFFGEIVNQSVVAFVKGDLASRVTADLQDAWADLRDAFAHGYLRNKPNAIMASQRAEENRQRVGCLP